MNEFYQVYSKVIVALAESIEVKPFSVDDEDSAFQDQYGMADQVEAIFKKCNIRSSRDSEISLVAIDEHETVVGAVYRSYSVENEGEDRDYIEYSFDVAVSPDMQKGGVGTMLIKAAIGQAMEFASDMPVKMRLWVVNPNLERVLTSLGFTESGRHAGGSCHMEKWFDKFAAGGWKG